MKIMLTGSNGLLGQKLIEKISRDHSFELIATSLGNCVLNSDNFNYYSLDVTNQEKINQFVSKHHPDAIINTAAVTNVDYCEQNKVQCDNVNVKAVEYLSEICSKKNIHLVHISSDFIFDGNKNDLYNENDLPNPLSYYGLSKLKSEKIFYDKKFNWTILRTSVVFGVAKNLQKTNIVLWAIEQLKNEKKIKIIDDEFRAPTLAEDLSEACINVIIGKSYGVYNTSGPMVMSIYEIVVEIARHFNFPVQNIQRISSKILAQKAKRPKFTGLELTKAKKKFNYTPKTFKESLSIIENQIKINK